MVELEQQRIGVRAVLVRQVGAHREDLLRHHAQLLNDGALGAALDGAQDFGDVGHGMAFLKTRWAATRERVRHVCADRAAEKGEAPRWARAQWLGPAGPAGDRPPEGGDAEGSGAVHQAGNDRNARGARERTRRARARARQAPSACQGPRRLARGRPRSRPETAPARADSGWRIRRRAWTPWQAGGWERHRPAHAGRCRRITRPPAPSVADRRGARRPGCRCCGTGRGRCSRSCRPAPRSRALPACRPRC